MSNINIHVSTETIVDKVAETVSVRATAWQESGAEFLDLETATGTAKTAAPDKFDPTVGVEIATGRALRSLGRKLLKEGQNRVHEQDKVRKSQEEARIRNAALKAARRQVPEPYATVRPGSIELHADVFKTLDRAYAARDLRAGLPA